jgi:hypothetical protein
MTELNRSISRRTRLSYPVLYRNARQIVVTLVVGDVIEFREAGRRARWPLPIDSAFKYAVRLKASTDAAEKRHAKKNRNKKAVP